MKKKILMAITTLICLVLTLGTIVATAKSDSSIEIIQQPDDYSIIEHVDVYFQDGTNVQVVVPIEALESMNVQALYDFAYSCYVQGCDNITIYEYEGEK